MTTPDLPVNMRDNDPDEVLADRPPANRAAPARADPGACTLATLAGDDDLSGLVDLYPFYCEDA